MNEVGEVMSMEQWGHEVAGEGKIGSVQTRQSYMENRIDNQVSQYSLALIDDKVLNATIWRQHCLKYVCTRDKS